MNVSFDVALTRSQFPVLNQRVGKRRLAYLDNAATTHKPQAVMSAVDRYYGEYNSNIHRAVHTLSQKATEAYESSRQRVAEFLGADRPDEIVFTAGTTAGINLVANSWADQHIQPGDEILISHLEHHSNIVPWQLLCERRGCTLKVIPVLEDGQLDLSAYEQLLSERTRLVALSHVSNTLGVITPLDVMIPKAKEWGATVLIDGAQAVAHLPVNVTELGCDFYVFSGHKLYGPTGIGVLWGRGEVLHGMPPWQGGGDMIETVSFAGSTWAEPPARFEAGTPNIVGAIGLAAAIDYFDALDHAAVTAHEDALLRQATEALLNIPGLRILGTAEPKLSVISFTLEGVHPHDIGMILNKEGVAIRTGHHCTQPLMERFGLDATARASFALYNDQEDVSALLHGLETVRRLFA
ncbi:MAG TPA: cysteine desulfurase CsdA [Myxococcales bacterium]|nr:cysteine desulfurase CsdA [Myxococcales bacterium]